MAEKTKENVWIETVSVPFSGQNKKTKTLYSIGLISVLWYERANFFTDYMAKRIWRSLILKGENCIGREIKNILADDKILKTYVV